MTGASTTTGAAPSKWNGRAGFEGFIGTSPSMRRLYDLLRRVGPSTASVLLVGESGTGKELAARTLHRLSKRRDGPFVGVNCAAIPDTLIEGELFGHEKGAFTGAVRRQRGCFELANGGTLFLDEITAMPLSSQAKLLRVLEEKAFRRLRGSEELRVDVRVVAATNEDPETAIHAGRLREDLLYRIDVFTLVLPPLRERRSDVSRLANHFLRQFAEANGKKGLMLAPEAEKQLLEHDWPGNVRELRNAIERGAILAEGRFVTGEDLLPTRRNDGRRMSRRATTIDEIPLQAPESPSFGSDHGFIRVGMSLEEATRRLILRTLEATNYNKTKAAEILDVSAKTVYNKLKRWVARGDSEAIRTEKVSAGSARASVARPARSGEKRARLVSIDAARKRRLG